MWIKSFLAGVLGLCTASSWANVSVTVEHVPAAQASPAFTFKNLPPLSPQNLAIGTAGVRKVGMEGILFRKVFGWSILFLLGMCVLAFLQSTPVLGWMRVGG